MARAKKSRTMRGKLGKTGSKEQMKEQKKAQKSKDVRRFQVKKANQRKEQAQKKLERLGLATEEKQETPVTRARRFTYVPKAEQIAEDNAGVLAQQDDAESNDLSTSDLLDAFTETE